MTDPSATEAAPPAEVQVLDSTLREGEQKAGVRFAAEEKIVVLHLLEDFGIRLAEVGHPGISHEDERICRDVRIASRWAEILMHARADIAEVRAAHRARAHWVGIWASVNDLGFETKFVGRSLGDVLGRIRSAVAEAKELGLKVRFTIEDASRTGWERLAAAALTAKGAGADRISLADTIGALDPASSEALFSRAVEEFGGEIEGHFHNDLGLALANALAAIDVGVHVVDASVLGLGERVGITDLLQLAVVLKLHRGDGRFDLDLIPELARVVGLASGHRPDEIRPIVGRDAFTHSSAYHVEAVRRNPQAYEGFPPELPGRRRRMQDRRPPLKPPRIPVRLRVGRPFRREASELRYHRDGPGMRWVLLDSRVDDRASLYVMQRLIMDQEAPSTPHVDLHRHTCDSVLVFFGRDTDGRGLCCRVVVGEEEETVDSPATVFVPAWVDHSYSYLEGQGIVLNIVLSGDYDASLAEPTENELTGHRVTLHSGQAT
jgi:2-isopropylmalate synthase